MTEKPNIIVIYTDQQRYDTLHCCGNPLIQTPNLDQLAREGCLFHQHHVTTPVCVPSRVSFFTGRYAHSTGSYNNSRLMAPDETDFVSGFRNAGYRTVLLGKDHCFGRKRVREVFDHVEDAGHCRISPALSPRSGDIQELRSDKMQVAMAEDPSPPTIISRGRYSEAPSTASDNMRNPSFCGFRFPIHTRPTWSANRMPVCTAIRKSPPFFAAFRY